jgi:SAM-dependent methyltransferase
MRWQVKAAVQAALSRVPYHARLYGRLQRAAGTYPLDVAEVYDRKARFLNRMAGQGLTPDDKVVVEIGTGWYPFLPILFSLLGAKRVVTMDLNPWLSPRTLGDTLAGVRSLLDRIAADFGRPADQLRAKFEAAAGGAGPRPEVRPTLARFGVEYRMPCDAGATGLPDGSVDYVVSSNVFEHIPGPVIGRILTESRRIVRPGGHHLHHINPGDHFSIGDRRITTAHFLRYSPGRWYWIGGSGVAYHNRLRGVDYVRLFEKHGLTVTHTYQNVDPRALDELKSGRQPVHPDFAGYTAEELAVDVIGVYARNPG